MLQSSIAEKITETFSLNQISIQHPFLQDHWVFGEKKTKISVFHRCSYCVSSTKETWHHQQPAAQPLKPPLPPLPFSAPSAPRLKIMVPKIRGVQSSLNQRSCNVSCW